MHVNEAFFLVEIEDVETGEIITEAGRDGKMVITALDRILASIKMLELNISDLKELL